MSSVIAHTSIPGTGGGGGPFTSSAIDTTGASLLIINVANAFLFDPVLSDSKGNTWHFALSLDDVSNNSQFNMAYAWNPTVGSGHTFTVDGALNFVSAEVIAFSGIRTSSDPLDQINTNRGGSISTLQTGSITPSQNGSLLVAGLATSQAAGYNASINNSFSITDQLPLSAGEYYGSAVAWKDQGVAAAINPTWTMAGGTHDLTGGIASFVTTTALISVAITESADSIAATVFGNASMSVAITEGADSVAASLGSTFNVAVAITESPDAVSADIITEALLAIAITESPDAIFADLRAPYNISIAIGSEDADSVAIVLENAGSWANCPAIDTDWANCSDPTTTWTTCTNPTTDWTVN